MICESNKKVSAKVKDFMLNVSRLNEESITDYLVWKWRELDKKFNYINIRTFTHDEESNKTGADLELELWLIGRSVYIPLVFQAKKFIKPHDKYVQKLNYPEWTQNQLKTLLKYAKSGKKPQPFYLIYSVPDSKTKVMCGKNPELEDTSLFMLDAHTVKEFADYKYGSRISRDDILKQSNPFHCLFCCPLSISSFFRHYFDKLNSETKANQNNEMPEYVSMLLNNRLAEMNAQEILTIIERNELSPIRYVCVYDLRQSEKEL